VVIPSPLTSSVVGIAALVTVVLGVAPQFFLDLASDAGVFVR
jgi:NADH-quinone oxidoreductase subunit N